MTSGQPLLGVIWSFSPHNFLLEKECGQLVLATLAWPASLPRSLVRKANVVTQICNPSTPPARREEETREWAEHVCSTAAEVTRQILPREQDGSNKCAKPNGEKPTRPKSFTKDYRHLRKRGVGEAASPGKAYQMVARWLTVSAENIPTSNIVRV